MLTPLSGRRCQMYVTQHAVGDALTLGHCRLNVNKTFFSRWPVFIHPPGRRAEAERVVGAVLLPTDGVGGYSKLSALCQTTFSAPRRHGSGQNTRRHTT